MQRLNICAATGPSHFRRFNTAAKKLNQIWTAGLSNAWVKAQNIIVFL